MLQHHTNGRLPGPPPVTPHSESLATQAAYTESRMHLKKKAHILAH